MADQGLFEKTTTTAKQTGDFIRINRANASNPSGREDLKITEANFLSDLTLDIASNKDSISVLESDVSDMQDIISIYTLKGTSSDVQFSQPSDSEITRITIKGNGLSNSVKIGTTLGGDDILTLRSLPYTLDNRLSISNNIYSESGQTIYFTITGTVSLNIYYSKNNFLTI